MAYVNVPKDLTKVKTKVLFNLTNLKLIIGTTVITFAIYAVFYTLVYRITSNSYYSIVAGAKEEHT